MATSRVVPFFGNRTRSFSTRSSTPSPKPLLQAKRATFQADLLTNGYRYGKYPGQKPVLGLEFDRNLSLYDVSSQTRLPMVVIGPSRNVWLPSVLHNFGGASVIQPFLRALKGSRFVDENALNQNEEQAAMEELIKLNSSEPSHLREGSVLFEAYWNLALNDSFIRGAVDSGKEIHIALPGSVLSIEKNLLYDFTNKRPTVLGRELLNIASQGYAEIKHKFPGLGIVLAPQRNPPVLTLKDSLKLVDDAKGPDDVLEGLAELFKETAQKAEK